MSEVDVSVESRPLTRRPESAAAPGRAQLARLFRLVVLLQTERSPNARELAERCEVSRRTVYRDLELLAAAGIPVQYRQERQGYQLAKGFVFPPTNLTESEALALIVLARQWKSGDLLGLLRHAWDGVLKVVQGLPVEIRDRVLAAGESFRSTEEPSQVSPARQKIHETLLLALTAQRQLRLWYRDALTNGDVCTKFALYRVLLQGSHWYLVGRSSLHRRVDVIGLPWVERADLTEDRYTIPPRFNLKRFLGQAWGVDRGSIRYCLWLRFSARVAPGVLEGVWHPSQRREELVDGRVDLRLDVDGLDEVLGWVLRFGDDVEVLEPRELRERLHDVATRVARLNEPEPPGEVQPNRS